MDKDKLEKNHNCDNVNCNHNNTKGLCCLFNPESCKYRQLQKENAELKKMYHETDEDNNKLRENIPLLAEAKEIIKKLQFLYLSPVVTKDDVKRQDEILAEVKQFLKDSEVEK
jgi:hypothetical protein